MSGTIGYFDAWRLWFGGQEVDPQLRMGFMSILWWGRVGKIAAFLGGATVLLDLIGPDRLRRFGRRRKSVQSIIETFGLAMLILLFIVGLLAPIARVYIDTPYWTIFVLPLVGIACFGFASSGADRAAQLVVHLLDTDRPAQAIRYVAVALLLVGFHFDLLAS